MIKKLILVLLVFNTIIMSAQRNSASPYSYFGIGETFEAVTVEQASMGGIGVALKEKQYLNFVNPAANADLRVATYGIGASSNYLTLEKEDSSQSGSSTSLRYITLGVPLGKKAGISFGLQPFSSVGYSLLNDTNKEDITLLSGEGGTNKIYTSFGLYIVKGLSIGIEAGYIFGNLENNILNNRINTLTTKYKQKIDVRGGQFKFGAQYKTKLKGNVNLHTGASFTLNGKFSTEGYQKMYSFSLSNLGRELVRDELFDRPLNQDIGIPTRTVFGFGLGEENKWYIGINQQFQNAFSRSSALISDGNGYKYDDSSKLSIGGYYIPKINSLSNYWDRITYRAGLRFEDTGLIVQTGTNSTEIKDFGINIGLGLPLPRQLSNINIGFEYGEKGTAINDLIKEKYFNFRLSLSLSSLKWFNKRKID